MMAQPHEAMPAGTGPRAGATLRLDAISKRFGSVTAVNRVSLEIPAGSFVSLLGPSGSGKTTTLNMIAGFLRPDEGELYFDGRPVANVAPNKRDIGMVFQSYALFPHMTVYENVAFPLRARGGLDGAAIDRRVREQLEMVRLADFGERFPKQLSGGQRQRVAMARAVVARPSVLLLDEPLGALDKNLRDQLQGEIKKIHRSVGSTFVYVTHDQSEALNLSDLVVVMREGRIEQASDPRTIYQAPETPFVAEFMGGANLLPATVASCSAAVLALDLHMGGRVLAPASGSKPAEGEEVSLLVRPEDVLIAEKPPADPEVMSLSCSVLDVAYFGDTIRLSLDASGTILTARVPARGSAGLNAGQQVLFCWRQGSARVLRRRRYKP